MNVYKNIKLDDKTKLEINRINLSYLVELDNPSFDIFQINRRVDEILDFKIEYITQYTLRLIKVEVE